MDAFAGPGVFGDSQPGSPLIICRRIDEAVRKGLGVSARAIFIEVDTEWQDSLVRNVSPYSFAAVFGGTFESQAGHIAELAKTHSTFLYLDPFTVEGLDWFKMDMVFQQLDRSKSVELLLNFNANSFVRRAMAAMKMSVPPEEEVLGEGRVDSEFAGPPTFERLNIIAGGEWWKDIINEPSDYREKIRNLTGEYCGRLQKRFREVCYHEIMGKPNHLIPKYSLVFATRSVDGLLLMNNEMAKSHKRLADEAKPKEETLFEMRSEELVPDDTKLTRLVLAACENQSTRRDVIANVIRKAFCMYEHKDIRGRIELLIKQGRVRTQSGKARINDDELIWRA